VTTNGIIIRQHAKEIRLAGRNTQGVRLIRLEEGDTISDVTAVAAEEDDPTEKVDHSNGGGAEGSGRQPGRKSAPAPAREQGSVPAKNSSAEEEAPEGKQSKDRDGTGSVKPGNVPGKKEPPTAPVRKPPKRKVRRK
jgi:DNA gyrase/topoisomerase IV subunit A